MFKNNDNSLLILVRKRLNLMSQTSNYLASMNLNKLYFLVICICSSLFSLAQNPDFEHVEFKVIKRVEAYAHYSHSNIAPQRLRDTYSKFKVSIKNNGNVPIELNFNYIYGVDRNGKTYELKFPNPLASKIKTIKPKNSLKQTLFFEPTARHKPIYVVIEDRRYSLY